MLKAVVSLAFLAAAASAQPFVICSGLAEIPGTYDFSFDRGQIVHADVYWRQIRGGPNRAPVRYLRGFPRSGMVNLGVVDFNSLALEQLYALKYEAQRIEGGDRNNELVVSDVFAVRTKGGNYAKAIVRAVSDPQLSSGLTLEWVTYARLKQIEGKAISAGTVEIFDGTKFSFDTGLAADVFWEQVDPERRYLLPSGASRIVNLGITEFARLSLTELQKLNYDDPRSNRIDGSNGKSVLVTGDVFAVRTNGGNYAKALVTAELDHRGNHGLVLEWVTYAGK